MEWTVIGMLVGAAIGGVIVWLRVRLGGCPPPFCRGRDCRDRWRD